jgi:hypothetical protein
MILAIPALLVLLAGLVCSLLGCVVPLAALAAFAAIFVSRRVAMLAIGATWILNQLLGFTIHHYPPTVSTFAWGIAIGVAAFAAYGVARIVRANAALALLASFVAFEGVLMLFSVRLGDWGAYAPSILLLLFATNVAWFAGMFALTTYGLRLHPSR